MVSLKGTATGHSQTKRHEKSVVHDLDEMDDFENREFF